MGMSETPKDFVNETMRKIVFIDETEKTGRQIVDTEYVLGATVIDAAYEENFAGITKKRYNLLNDDEKKIKKELKFHLDWMLRDGILREVSELDPDLYATTVTKAAGREWTPKEQRTVGRNTIYDIITKISNKEEDSYLHLVVDTNNKVKSGVLEEIVEEIKDGRTGLITFEIGNSEENFGLQTNDFGVGAMGKLYNHGNDKYVSIVGRPVDRTRIKDTAEDIVERIRTKKK